jgi:hypothetical protein
MRTNTKTTFVALSLSMLVLVIGLVGCGSNATSASMSTVTPASTATSSPTATFTPTATLAVQSVVHGKSFSIALPAGWTVQTQDDFAGGGAYTPLPGNFGFTTVLNQSPDNFVAIDEHKPAPVVLATYCQALVANSAIIAGLRMKHDTNTAPGRDAWHFVSKSNILYDIVIGSGSSGIDPAQRALFMQVLATFKPLDSTSACS